MDSNTKLKYFLTSVAEKEIGELKESDRSFFKNYLVKNQSLIYEFCENTDYELLLIDVTYEHGNLDLCFEFLTTPSEFRKEGLEAFTLEGIKNTLDELVSKD